MITDGNEVPNDKERAVVVNESNKRPKKTGANSSSLGSAGSEELVRSQ